MYIIHFLLSVKQGDINALFMTLLWKCSTLTIFFGKLHLLCQKYKNV